MPDPRLSASQRAYLFHRDNFLEGIRQRAEALYDTGYAVWPTNTSAVFVITYEGKNGERHYFVNPVARTCTCPFTMRQREGEPLTDDGTLVLCKHLRGLRKLIRQMAETLKAEGDLSCYYRLRTHWIGVRAALRDNDNGETEAVSVPVMPRTATKGES